MESTIILMETPIGHKPDFGAQYKKYTYKTETKLSNLPVFVFHKSTCSKGINFENYM